MLNTSPSTPPPPLPSPSTASPHAVVTLRMSDGAEGSEREGRMRENGLHSLSFSLSLSKQMREITSGVKYVEAEQIKGWSGKWQWKGKARHGKARQDKVRLGETRQDKTRQDRTGQD
ncbi:hypothetical protein E2C01_079676 [Portunus trituberculatus]|uniref:Uncharacterized protein n=1 Tax=Portunus trituberculatus TaxID=210409 RepID=A0A5B7IR80_PORTR|nr:hypothetical protein [Portunus trituberculatus]